MNKNYFIVVSMFLVGCQLAPNQSVHDTTVIKHQHWLTTVDAEQKLGQGLNAYLPLDDAFMSIASRIYLIQNAKEHIDIQYYIWNNDFVGQLILYELLQAADRGVKVRLLIDDHNGIQLDDQFSALAQHPNFQIKIYNPYKYRNFRVLDYIFRLKQVNRRMHNKLFVADGTIAVTGGRNISSEYFEASEHFQFTDLDILFYGNAVEQANQVFQTFWNDDLSYPFTQLVDVNDFSDLVKIRAQYKKYQNNETISQEKIDTAQHLLKQKLNSHQLQWAKAYFIADHPDKTRAIAKQDALLFKQMQQLMGQPKHHLELISAYFVPTEQGVNYLMNLAKNQVKTRVLTNSLLANDVAVVHAFYQNHRQQLLQGGVELYEFKSKLNRDEKTWYEIMTGNMIPAKGKSSSSLHAKFFDMDGKVFIGSFNFDPRSMVLNTEVGLVIESQDLQNRISQQLDVYLPKIAYQVKLDQKGQVIWLEHTPQGIITHYVDPESNDFQRFMVDFVAMTPFEGLM